MADEGRFNEVFMEGQLGLLKGPIMSKTFLRPFDLPEGVSRKHKRKSIVKWQANPDLYVECAETSPRLSLEDRGYHKRMDETAFPY